NRAELHLHGGLNPYISDGTPHQWITPAGDPTPNKKGAAFANVPDMVGPGNLFPTPTAGDGIGTYFYTNQQSGRLMFYHDHTFGLTRLNVYLGEAAGYLLVDNVEKKLIADGILPNNGGGINTYGIPLIIQDKTFVPGPSDLADTDPTWDTTNWGGYGDLWYPHVYMPNQNPGDPSGANAMGRWDYGPWFWPPVPVADAVNSIPTAHGPKPGINPGEPDYPGTPNPSLVIESFLDTPVVNGTPYPTVTLEPKAYRFRILNASNDRPFGLGFYYADPAHPTEVKMIPATPAEAAQGPLDDNGLPLWPTDGRDGGVVDFRTKGPDIIQIGNESGFLPEPVIIPSQATTYNMNRRDIVVLNIANHGLFLMAAQRADVIVDFSAVPSGSTLILYNDMLAPVPAFDVRYDYFTGDPDQTATGGAPTTLEGYGPNTRTVMQVKIQGTPAPAPFDVAALQAAFRSTATSNGAFAATQHPPIVPQTFYNGAMNTTVATDTYVPIEGNTLSYVKTENGQPVVMPLQPKAIHELFELNYGRMNSTLAIELPFTNFNNQTTIPLGYSEPATEILKDGETQIWKITHNGVDTHPVHFHLFDVQIINRVGWDGAVRFPEPNELGWNETVKMNPLEDIIVAMRPISPKLPFVLGNSMRVIDPSKTEGSTIQVTDLATGTPTNLGNLGNPIFVPNAVTDYGWEYVWHCHILAHEENDFMRPMVLNVATTEPLAPSALVGTVNGPTRVDLAWVDGSTNETGFRVERNPGPLG
ncbi:MAG: multicopper oxidase domain-containing protein, partial [Holophaga sp.]